MKLQHPSNITGPNVTGILMLRYRSIVNIPSSLCRLYGRFVRNTRGAAAVEFALVAVPFLATILVSMAVGVVFFFNTTLDFAVQKAARSMMTGAVMSGKVSAAQYQSTVFCPMLMAMFDCSKVIINVKVERPAAQAATTTGYSDLLNATQTALLFTAYTSPGSAQFCTGQPGDYVYIQVLYPMAALLMFLSPSGSVATLQGQPAFLLNSTLAFRNEQFSTNTGC